jgi:hypothetical protein
MAWYETFFDEHYLERGGLTIPQERTQQEVNFIRETLELPEGARILDLGFDYACKQY